MARYLLTADDTAMEAWKATAQKRGVTFAEFVRQALNNEMQRAAVAVPVTVQSPAYPGHVWKGPDFKKPAAEKKPRGR